MTTSDNNANSADTPLEFPYSLEPMFWGTGEMLVWETGQLLEAFNRERMYTVATAHDADGDGDLPPKDEFMAIVDDIYRSISNSEREGPRGFYSFFPVLPEGTSISILDPSDFHTELLRLAFSASETINGRAVAAYFRPDGDVLSLSTFTVGRELTDMFREVGNDSYISTVCTIIETNLYREVELRINGEIRRAMGIDGATGRSFSFNTANSVHGGIPRDLHEILSIEERLGIVSEFDCTHQNYPAAIRYFIHHPVVE